MFLIALINQTLEHTHSFSIINIFHILEKLQSHRNYEKTQKREIWELFCDPKKCTNCLFELLQTKLKTLKIKYKQLNKILYKHIQIIIKLIVSKL